MSDGSLEHHRLAEAFMAKADDAVRSGDLILAREYWLLAAEQQEHALRLIPPERVRTVAIITESARALRERARGVSQAERSLFGAIPDLTGALTTEEYLAWARGEERGETAAREGAGL
jgi:hypothetical protein